MSIKLSSLKQLQLLIVSSTFWRNLFEFKHLFSRVMIFHFELWFDSLTERRGWQINLDRRINLREKITKKSVIEFICSYRVNIFLYRRILGVFRFKMLFSKNGTLESTTTTITRWKKMWLIFLSITINSKGIYFFQFHQRGCIATDTCDIIAEINILH